jgi:plasmid maintenance system antidote protein VapI
MDKLSSLAAYDLLDYMKTHGLSIRATAKLIQIDSSRLSRLLRGIGKPSLDEAIRIETITGIAPVMWMHK